MAVSRDPLLEHYRRVSEQILPWLDHRPFRSISASGVMEEDVDARIGSAEDLHQRVLEGMAGIMVSPVSDQGEVWCFTRMQPMGIPFEAVRLAALKLRLALRDAALDAMAVYDGDRGLLIGWSWGVPDPDEVPGTLSSWHAEVARGLRRLTEERLAGTPERDRIGRWLGFEGPVALPGAGREGIRFEGLGPEDRLRVPFSVHEGTGRCAVPMLLDGLYRFEPYRGAEPASVRRLKGRPMPPLNFVRAVQDVFIPTP